MTQKPEFQAPGLGRIHGHMGVQGFLKKNNKKPGYVSRYGILWASTGPGEPKWDSIASPEEHQSLGPPRPDLGSGRVRGRTAPQNRDRDENEAPQKVGACP